MPVMVSILPCRGRIDKQNMAEAQELQSILHIYGIVFSSLEPQILVSTRLRINSQDIFRCNRVDRPLPVTVLLKAHPIVVMLLRLSPPGSSDLKLHATAGTDGQKLLTVSHVNTVFPHPGENPLPADLQFLTDFLECQVFNEVSLFESPLIFQIGDGFHNQSV